MRYAELPVEVNGLGLPAPPRPILPLVAREELLRLSRQIEQNWIDGTARRVRRKHEEEQRQNAQRASDRRQMHASAAD